MPLRRWALALLTLLPATMVATEPVARDPAEVRAELATVETVAFDDAQLRDVLAWLTARHQLATAMGRDDATAPELPMTLTIHGAMALSDLLDTAAAATGWTWSIDEHGVVRFQLLDQ